MEQIIVQITNQEGKTVIKAQGGKIMKEMNFNA
jgi:hypothetical protein